MMRVSSSILKKIRTPLLMVTAMMVGGVSPAHAEDVLIVLSSESKPYTEAADESAAALKAEGLNVERVLISEIDQNTLKEHGTPVIAIGGTAATQLAASLPADTELYYCMTPRPDRIGLIERANTSGVSTDPDFKSQVNILERSGIDIERVGMLYTSSSESSKSLRDRFAEQAPQTWDVVSIDLDEAGSGAKGIDMLFDRDVDVVWTAADPAVYDASLVRALLLRSIRERVPVFGFSHALVRAGAPFGVGFDPGQQGERVAKMLLKRQLGSHEPSDTVFAINNTALDRIRLKLSNELNRLAEVRTGTD